jgi:hypothetical protein
MYLLVSARCLLQFFQSLLEIVMDHKFITLIFSENYMTQYVDDGSL